MGGRSKGVAERSEAHRQRAPGRPPLPPHMLRHNCATELLRRGVTLRVIQDAPGHKNISITQIYTHVVNYDVRRCYAVNVHVPQQSQTLCMGQGSFRANRQN